jgi:hypothetical protein
MTGRLTDSSRDRDGKSSFSLVEFLGLIFALAAPVGSLLLFYWGYTATKTLAISALLACVCVAPFIRRTSFKIVPKLPWAFFALLLVGAALRLPINTYYAGGQDQGIYVSMAKYFQTFGTFRISDPTLALIPEHLHNFYNTVLAKDYAGVLTMNGEKIFPFYPAHPIYMAMAISAFGDGWHGITNFLFGLITLGAFYGIGRETTGEKKYGLLLMAFMAVNPLHVFHSRFPVTETPSLAFTSLAALYTVRFFKDAREKSYPVLYLLAGLIYWNAFLYVRMSAFMYIPYIYAMLLVAILTIDDRKARVLSIVHYGLSILLVVISMAYYENFIQFLYYSTIRNLLILPLGEDWRIKAVGLAVAALIVPVMAIYWRGWAKQKFIKIMSSRWFANGSLAVLAALLLYNTIAGIYGIYKFEPPMPEIIGRIATVHGWMRICVLSIWNTFLYFSPVGFVFFFYSLVRFKDSRPALPIWGFSLFSLYFLLLTIFHNKYTFGGYYYGRYQLSEILPYGLVAVVYGLSTIPSCRLTIWKFSRGTAVIAAILFFFAYHSVCLTQGNEGPRPVFYQQIAETVKVEDLLVLVLKEPGLRGENEIGTPLKYYFGLNVIGIESMKVVETADWQEVARGFRNVYFLTQEPITNRFASPAAELPFRFNIYHNGSGHLYLGWAAKSGVFNSGHLFSKMSLPSMVSKYQNTYQLYSYNHGLMPTTAPLGQEEMTQ